jgi:hypothetical protein
MTAATVDLRQGRIDRGAIRQQRPARADRLLFELVRVLFVVAIVALALIGIAEVATLFAAGAPPVGTPTPGFGL